MGARMLYDSQHPAAGTMPAEIARAPLAGAAGKIDFAGDALADPSRCIFRVPCAPRFGHLAHKLVTGNARKAVVAALQLEVRGADSRSQHSYARKSSWHPRQ